MKKRVITLLIVAFVINLGFSQEVDDKKRKSLFWENVQFGGGVTLGFTNNVTNIGVSPSAIYNFNDEFSAGLGVSYLYSKAKNITDALNVYGGSLLALYKPFQEFQFSAEFEETILNQSGFDSRNIEAFYLGGAYTVGRNIAIGVRYDVLYDDEKSLYGSAFTPIVRVYF